MKMFSSARDYVERLSSREKLLLLSLVGALVVTVLFFTWLFVSSSIDTLEEDITYAEEQLSGIKILAGPYLEKKQRQDTLREIIEKNPIKILRTPINSVAKTITLPEFQPTGATVDGDPKSQKLSDIIGYEGKVNELKLSSKKKGKKDKKDPSGFWRIEQDIEFTNVELVALFNFAEQIANSDELMFITSFEIMRKYNNLDWARANLSIATVKYVTDEEEETE